MNKKLLFSVLIANYNNGCFLQDAIDSILAQDYDNWEIIIVDDKSPDNSVEVYNRYRSDNRFHVYFNDKNRGVGYTKRRCVEMANSEICGFLDPDDVLSASDALKVMVETHIANSDVSMVYSGYYEANESLVVKREVHGENLPEGVTVLESCSWPIRAFVTFKKSAYDKTEGLNILMKNAEDYDLYYKLEEVGKVLHIERLLYTYRKNRNSISLNDGEYKSRVWHSYACVEAMKRRGLTDERLMLFPVEDALKIEFLKGIEYGKQCETYMVGDAVLKPFKLIKRMFGRRRDDL